MIYITYYVHLMYVFGRRLTVDVSKIKFSSINQCNCLGNTTLKHDLQSIFFSHATGVVGIVFFEPWLQGLFSETKFLLSGVITYNPINVGRPNVEVTHF